MEPDLIDKVIHGVIPKNAKVILYGAGKISNDNGIYYMLTGEHKVYLSDDEKQAQKMANNIWYELERENSPHRYLNPEADGIDVPEGVVLRSMRGIIESDEPLTMLICTYHRQADWDRYESFLNPDPENPRFDIYPSSGYYWHMPDPAPPYFRRGIMRARKRTKQDKQQR